MAKGIILFAHGSRDPAWSRPMLAVAAQIELTHPHALVRCAYLELMQPDLTTAASQLVEQGVTALTIVPMFLGMGKHVREDLPALADALQAAYPQVKITRQAAVGEDPRLISLLAELACE